MNLNISQLQISTPGSSRTVSTASSAYKTSYPKTLLVQNPQKGLVFGQYRLLQTVGSGEFGKVKLALLPSLQPVAVKFVKKSMLSSKSKLSKLLREIKLLEQVKHRHIVRLYEVLESEKYIGIVMEFAENGELFDYILKKRCLKEAEAKRLFVQLISAVGYLHRQGIVHRDLKLENLLLDSDKNIKITDLGFANITDPDQLLTTSCGSPCYASPELVLNPSYLGRPADIWSCGVILYAMLCGYLPFDDDKDNPDSANVNQLYKYILLSCDGDKNTAPLGFNFPDYVSHDAQDLIRKILCINPDDRLTISEILNHSWMSPVASYAANPQLEQFDDIILSNGSLDTVQTRDRAVSEPLTLDAAEQQKRSKFLSIDTSFSWFRKQSPSSASSSAREEYTQDSPLFSAPLSSAAEPQARRKLGLRSLLFRKSPVLSAKQFPPQQDFSKSHMTAVSEEDGYDVASPASLEAISPQDSILQVKRQSFREKLASFFSPKESFQVNVINE